MTNIALHVLTPRGEQFCPSPSLLRWQLLPPDLSVQGAEVLSLCQLLLGQLLQLQQMCSKCSQLLQRLRCYPASGLLACLVWGLLLQPAVARALHLFTVFGTKVHCCLTQAPSQMGWCQ